MDHSRLEKADGLRYEGDYEAAAAIYQQLLAEFEADPEVYLVRHGLGLCLCFSGEFDESIAELEQMRGLAPDFLKGRVDLFKTYLMLGMNDEALAEMREVRRMDPGNEEVAKAAVYFPDF